MTAKKSGIKKVNRRLPFHPDEVRRKIQALRLVQTLQDFIFEAVDKNGRKLAELSMPQVRAIDILLKKVVPDLTRTLISADLNVRYVAELPKVLTQGGMGAGSTAANHLDLTGHFRSPTGNGKLRRRKLIHQDGNLVARRQSGRNGPCWNARCSRCSSAAPAAAARPMACSASGWRTPTNTASTPRR